METICGEGGCVMKGTDEELIFIQYWEYNLGAQAADAASGSGWTNIISLDSTPVINNTNRPPLAPNASRSSVPLRHTVLCILCNNFFFPRMMMCI